jgi:hypothetical protein
MSLYFRGSQPFFVDEHYSPFTFASEHRHEMSTTTSTVYKYVNEHYPISKENCAAREHQVENPWSISI